MKDALLRALLLVDAAVLLALGGVLIAAPRTVERLLHFNGVPESVDYIVGSWGCALATMAIGYGVAARDPIRHVVWVQVGIARSVLECLVGAFYLSKGIVTFQQVGRGLIVAAVVGVAYLLLYPRESAAAATLA
jgi:hypothetical protein